MREDYSQTISEEEFYVYKNSDFENNNSDAITLIMTFGIVIFICLFPATMFSSGNISRR